MVIVYDLLLTSINIENIAKYNFTYYVLIVISCFAVIIH